GGRREALRGLLHELADGDVDDLPLGGDDRDLLAVAVHEPAALDVVALLQLLAEMLERLVGDAAQRGPGEHGALPLRRVPGLQLVEQQVQRDRDDRGGADARMEDRLEPGGEGGVDVGVDHRQHAGSEGGGDDDHVAGPVVAHLAQRADARDRHRAEQHDPGPAEDRRGDGGHDAPEHGQQAEDHQDHSARRDDEAALDPGDRHEPDVLGEGALREAVEQRREEGGAHVGAQAVGDPPPVHLAVDDLAHGDDVRRGLGEDHDDHDQHRDDGGDLEHRGAERERGGQGEERSREDVPEVRLAGEGRQDGAQHDAQQDRESRDRRVAQLGQQQDDEQRREAEADVAQRRVVGRLGVVAHDPPAGHGEQGEPDGRDHDAGDHGWEEADDPREQRRDQEADGGGGHHGAEHGLDAARSADDGRHRRDPCERGPLDQRQARTEERDPEGLQDRRQTADEQAAGDQQGLLRRGDPGGSADDQGWGDDPAVHGQDVLQAVA